MDLGVWHVAAQPIELARLGARIAVAVQDERRYAQLVQAIDEESCSGRRRDVEPRARRLRE